VTIWLPYNRSSRKTKSPINYSYRVIALKEYGSGMGMIINAIRGIHVLVPRNMTKAGFLIHC
jgi:hypothetical protein